MVHSYHTQGKGREGKERSMLVSVDIMKERGQKTSMCASIWESKKKGKETSEEEKIPKTKALGGQSIQNPSWKELTGNARSRRTTAHIFQDT